MRSPTAIAVMVAAMTGTPAHAGSDGARSQTDAAAADSGTAASFGLREAVALASRRDPRLAVAAARRRAAEARYGEALLGYAPDVLVGAAYTNGFPGSGSDLQLRGMLGSPFFHHYVAGVDASWNLVELLRTPHAAAAAEGGIESAEAAKATVEREVALTVIDLFERIISTTDTRQLLLAEQRARQKQIGALRSRVEAGTVAREQLLQAEAGLADVEAELSMSAAAEQSTRLALSALTRADRVLRAPLRMEILSAEGELPEIRMARAFRKQASELAALHKVDWVPKLMLGASAGYANASPGSTPGLYAFGVALALPVTGLIRERARRDADIAAAEARAFEADATLEQISARLAELDGSIGGLQAALPAAEQSRRAADLALTAIAVRAEAGVTPQVDVEVARTALRRAEMRERALVLRLNGLKARRTFLQRDPGISPKQ